MRRLPVIDLFAGPGGLGEGFSAYRTDSGQPFRISLSVENDVHAHKTLELRAFFRQFCEGEAPDDYYEYLRGKILREDLFDRWPDQARAAKREAQRAELGSCDDDRIDQSIGSALQREGSSGWVLIGGPPCQAYSIIGRARMRHVERKEFEKDHRHFLYEKYLRIISCFRPAVFVMENVKGMLSSKIDGELIFERIIRDLRNPPLNGSSHATGVAALGYRVHSLQIRKNGDDLNPADYIIESERFGVPQTRHRVILLGIREDLDVIPTTLTPSPTPVVREVIGDLPALRSTLSREKDGPDEWRSAVRSIESQPWFASLRDSENSSRYARVYEEIVSAIERIDLARTSGAEFVGATLEPAILSNWYSDSRLGGACNHTARSHIREDLHRYVFAACYASVHDLSPMMRSYPKGLLPHHKNIHEAVNGDTFDDRFRVQLAHRPGATITSHIAKDGHYAIHYDGAQARSLTVREAARIQTFPDNYFFEGPRTQQYRQVGNAVPPLLARQIAAIVYDVFCQIDATRHFEHRGVPPETIAVVAKRGKRLPVATSAHAI